MIERDLRVLSFAETDDIFVEGGVREAVRIARSAPVFGELVRDSAGLYFLSPEEDHRGGGMGAVRIHDLPADAKRRLVGRVVKVAGCYEPARGLRVEAIVGASDDFEP